MRRTLIFIAIAAILAALFVGYEFIANLSYTRHITLPANMLAGSSTDIATASDASSTAAGDILNTASPASSTIDTSSWRFYANAPAGYSLRYPSDLAVNADASGDLVLAFPKDHYFHWPLLDDAKVTISASSTCPSVGSDMPNILPMTVMVNGYAFRRIEGGGVGAGNIYRELAYDLQTKQACYHIDLLDHGANGAGLYVGDQSLIASYDAAHAADLTAVLGIFNALVNTFRLSQNVL